MTLVPYTMLLSGVKRCVRYQKFCLRWLLAWYCPLDIVANCALHCNSSGFPKVSMWKCKNSSVPVSRFHYLRDYTELSPACDALPRLTLVSPPPLSSSPPDGENNENMFPAPDFVLQIIILVTPPGTTAAQTRGYSSNWYSFCFLHEMGHDSES